MSIVIIYGSTGSRHRGVAGSIILLGLVIIIEVYLNPHDYQPQIRNLTHQLELCDCEALLRASKWQVA